MCILHYKRTPITFFLLSPQSTRALLLAFSRDYLSGEGDICKHLTYLGFVASFEQSALEEFDFAVKNLAIDLRDGIRLA